MSIWSFWNRQAAFFVYWIAMALYYFIKAQFIDVGVTSNVYHKDIQASWSIDTFDLKLQFLN